jgi:hypothetical protein
LIGFIVFEELPVSTGDLTVENAVKWIFEKIRCLHSLLSFFFISIMQVIEAHMKAQF